MEQKEKRTDTNKRLLYKVVAILLLAIALFSAYQLITIQKDYYQGENEYDELEAEYVLLDPNPYTDDYTEEVYEKSPYYIINIENFQSLNKDFVGWMNLPDTSVRYPIVQTDNNDYYLTHTYRKKENRAGAIFLDYRSNSDYLDYNTIIYGHNMKNGTMFHTLESFLKKDFFESHPQLHIYTEEGIRVYEIFSILETDIYNDCYQISFDSNNAYNEWLMKMQNQSLYQTDIVLDENSRVVTLSTCTNTYDEGRYILQAVYTRTVKQNQTDTK